MDWRHIAIALGICGFLAAFLLGIVVERIIEAKEMECLIRERVASVECKVAQPPGTPP